MMVMERPREVIQRIFDILDEAYPDNELSASALTQKQILFDKLRYYVPQVIRVDNYVKSKSKKE
jgi:hypothetical protein